MSQLEIHQPEASTSRLPPPPPSQGGSEVSSSSSRRRRPLPWVHAAQEDFNLLDSGSRLVPKGKGRASKASSGGHGRWESWSGKPTSITNTPSSSSPTFDRHRPVSPRPSSPPARACPPDKCRLPLPARDFSPSNFLHRPAHSHAPSPPTKKTTPSRVSQSAYGIPNPADSGASALPTVSSADPWPKRPQKRGPAPDTVLFGDDGPPARSKRHEPEVQQVKVEPRPTLTKNDAVLFSKAPPLHKSRLFPKTVHRSSTGIIKPTAAPIDFQPVEQINAEQRKFARQHPVPSPAEADRDEASGSPTSNEHAREDKPVLSASASRHRQVLSKHHKSVPSSSSALTSSPAIHPPMQYSRDDLQKRFGRAPFPSDASDSDDEMVVVSSTSSSARSRSRATSPTSRGASRKWRNKRTGKGGKQQRQRENKQKDVKGKRSIVGASQRQISPELGEDVESSTAKGTRRRTTKPEEHYWRYLDVDAAVPPFSALQSSNASQSRTSEHLPPPTERLLKVCIRHVVTYSMDSVLDNTEGWDVDLVVELCAADNRHSPLISHNEQLRLVSSSLPDLSADYLATTPDGADSAGIVLPLSRPSPWRPLELAIKLHAGDLTYATMISIPTDIPYAFEGTLPFAGGFDSIAGIRASIMLVPSDHCPRTADVVVNGLMDRLERISLGLDGRGDVWIPDAVKVEVPDKQGTEKGPVRMVDLGPWKCGYDFVTKEPYEAGDIVKLYEGETVESLANLIASLERRVVTSSLGFEARTLARAQLRFCIMNQNVAIRAPPISFLT
ncbi:hypothetical protein JCM11251_000868 [Rhodosporidiobolus azoricus]